MSDLILRDEYKKTEIGWIPKEWNVNSLSRYIKKNRGICYGVVQPGFHDENGIPVIRVNNIRNGRITADDVLKVSSEIESKYSRSRLEGNEILITLVGNVGEIAIVDPLYKDWNVARAVGVLPIDSNLIDKNWLKYWLQSSQVTQYINSHCNTTVQVTLNLGDVSNLPVLEPSMEEQKRVADILSCLDRKIENLRRQNETLEEIARSIFKHWFIDFEFPNADGKPYKSSGGVMVRSELGDIPEGWHIKRFDSLGELNRGKSRHRPRYAEHLYGGTYPFIQTGDIKASQGFITEYEQTYNDAGLAQSRLWKDETLCIIIAANIAETGILTFPTCFSDSVIGFVADSSICDVYFIHRMFKYKKKEIEVESIGSVQKKLNLETIAKIKFITPDIKKHNDLVAVFRKLRSKIICSKQKIRTLTKIRDTLLPKLMSCQLRVEG